MAEEQAGWPVWQGAGDTADDELERYRLLARYVSTQVLDGLALTDTTVAERTVAGRGQDPAEARRAASVDTARHLYENLRERSYPYRIEAWTPERGQRVRHPHWVDQDGGTCLDLAVLYAALLLEGDVAPLLAVGEGPRTGHAFVLVDPSRGRSAVLTPDFVHDDGAQEFDEASGPRALDHGLIAVDVTQATRPYRSSFDEACAEGARQLRRYSRLVLVDVASLQSSGDLRYAALPAPPRTSVGISRRLPPMPRFRHFDSREKLLEGLGGKAGPQRTVLYGDQGTGKSMLAHQLAMKADHGCGWFLTASDRATLVTALSDAYLTEANQPGAEGRDNLDREGFALSALQQLRQSTVPWVVVLDNANCRPVDLQGWVPTPHAPGQRVIVTTTHADWTKADAVTAGFEVRLVKALEHPDVAGPLRHDERLLRLAQGRPLLAMSFGRLLDRLDPDGGTAALAARLADVPTVDGDKDDEMAGPEALWAIARKEIDADARRAAQALAWLPPDDAPLAALKPLVPDVDVALGQLAGTGVVAFAGADLATAVVSTHRLYLRAIREHPVDRRAGLDMLDEILATEGTRTILDEQADQATINLIATELLAAYAEAPAAGSMARALRWAAQLQELHGAIKASSDSYGAIARRLLVELGESPGGLAGPVDRAPDDYDVLADCLHGWARHTFQQSTDPVELQGAYDHIVLAVAIKGALGYERGAARSDALRGLILRKLAGFAPEDQRAALLEAALAIIDASATKREQLDDGVTTDVARAEVARAVYNLGGTRLRLAKSDPAQAAHHLDLGTKAYGRSLAIREEVYARKLHPHTAASRNGVGLMALYRALLVEGLGPTAVNEVLREATEYVAQALTDRAALDGNVDGGDTAKSAEVLAKILLMRAEVVKKGRAAEVMDEFQEELDIFNGHFARFRPAGEAT